MSESASESVNLSVLELPAQLKMEIISFIFTFVRIKILIKIRMVCEGIKKSCSFLSPKGL